MLNCQLNLLSFVCDVRLCESYVRWHRAMKSCQMKSATCCQLHTRMWSVRDDRRGVSSPALSRRSRAANGSRQWHESTAKRSRRSWAKSAKMCWWDTNNLWFLYSINGHLFVRQMQESFRVKGKKLCSGFVDLEQESLANAKVNVRQHCVSLSCLYDHFLVW